VVRALYIFSFRDAYEVFAKRAHSELGVIPVAWLGDPRGHAFAEESFGGHCLTADYRPLLAGTYIRPTFRPHDVVISFARFLDSNFFREIEGQLLNEFNRETHFSLLRTVDREARLRTVIHHLVGIYVDQRPEVLIASETPHGVVDLTAFYLAKWLGIPTLFFQPTSTIGPGLLPRTSLDEVFAIDSSTFNKPRVETLRSAFLKNTIALFSNGARPARMEAELEKHNAAPSRTSSRRVFLQRRFVSTILLLKNLLLESEWRKQLGLLVFSTYRDVFATAVGSLPSTTASGPPTAFFPLHYQPERTSLPEGGSEAFQGDLVVRARALLPPNVRLVVKEHPSSVTKHRVGYLGRSTNTFELVKSLPNTEMVGPDWDINENFESLVLCFTLTGSLGVQAALKGVPVIYFGNPWWQGMPGTTKHYEGMDLSGGLGDLGAAKSELVVDFLTTLTTSRTVPGFGTPSQERSWGKILNLPKEFFEAELDGLLSVTKLFLEGLPTAAKSE